MNCENLSRLCSGKQTGMFVWAHVWSGRVLVGQRLYFLFLYEVKNVVVDLPCAKESAVDNDLWSGESIFSANEDIF